MLHIYNNYLIYKLSKKMKKVGTSGPPRLPAGAAIHGPNLQGLWRKATSKNLQYVVTVDSTTEEFT